MEKPYNKIICENLGQEVRHALQIAGYRLEGYNYPSVVFAKRLDLLTLYSSSSLEARNTYALGFTSSSITAP